MSDTCASCSYCHEGDDEESALCMAMPPVYAELDGEPNYIRGAFIDKAAPVCVYFVPAHTPKSNARH